METKNKTTIAKDPVRKQLKVTRHFDAPLQQVWNAWTDAETLDKWWAPKPWKARTKVMKFVTGGYWHYAMVGPDQTEQWCRVDFESINPTKNFTANDMFCDEHGNIDKNFPTMRWNCSFQESSDGTDVTVIITFETEADMQKIIDLGFEEGFTAAHGNLDELLG